MAEENNQENNQEENRQEICHQENQKNQEIYLQKRKKMSSICDVTNEICS